MSEDLRWQEVFFGGGRRRWPNEKAEGAHAADGRRGSEIWADPAVRRSDLAGRSTSADLPCGRKLGSAPEERHVYSSPSFSIFPPAPQGRYEASAAPVCRPCGARHDLVGCVFYQHGAPRELAAFLARLCRCHASGMPQGLAFCYSWRGAAFDVPSLRMRGGSLVKDGGALGCEPFPEGNRIFRAEAGQDGADLETIQRPAQQFDILDLDKRPSDPLPPNVFVARLLLLAQRQGPLEGVVYISRTEHHKRIIAGVSLPRLAIIHQANHQESCAKVIHGMRGQGLASTTASRPK